MNDLCEAAGAADIAACRAESAICRRAYGATPWRLSPSVTIAAALNDHHWQIGGLLIGGGTEHSKVVCSTQQGGEDPGT